MTEGNDIEESIKKLQIATNLVNEWVKKCCFKLNVNFTNININYLPLTGTILKSCKIFRYKPNFLWKAHPLKKGRTLN